MRRNGTPPNLTGLSMGIESVDELLSALAERRHDAQELLIRCVAEIDSLSWQIDDALEERALLRDPDRMA